MAGGSFFSWSDQPLAEPEDLPGRLEVPRRYHLRRATQLTEHLAVVRVVRGRGNQDREFLAIRWEDRLAPRGCGIVQDELAFRPQ